MRPRAFDPRRCAVELQERGELEWACAVIARTAFRFVLVVPGGVVLSLAGVAIVEGREVAWPQVIECLRFWRAESRLVRCLLEATHRRFSSVGRGRTNSCACLGEARVSKQGGRELSHPSQPVETSLHGFGGAPVERSFMTESVSIVHRLFSLRELARAIPVRDSRTTCTANDSQDIEEDSTLFKASADIQRAWRGCTSRKRARWLRMEREGRRRLSRMRKEAEHERERARLLEEDAKEKLALEEERYEARHPRVSEGSQLMALD